MTEQPKTPGQLAYEEDVRRQPRYSDDGPPRKQWHELDQGVQSTWHKEPTPREWKRSE